MVERKELTGDHAGRATSKRVRFRVSKEENSRPTRNDSSKNKSRGLEIEATAAQRFISNLTACGKFQMQNSSENNGELQTTAVTLEIDV